MMSTRAGRKLSERGLSIGTLFGVWALNGQAAWAQGVQVVSGGGGGNVSMVDAIIVVVLIGLAVFSVCFSSRRY